MSKDEYERLKGLLSDVAEMQKTVADNNLKAEMRFALTEKAIADLLKRTKNRRRNK
jgi:hypothetical protein